MGMTLADMAQLSTLQPWTQRILYSILMPSPLASRIPFDDVGDIRTMVMEIRQLPTVHHRPLNPPSVNVASASFGQRVESLSIISDKIGVDRQALGNKSSHVDPMAAEVEAYTKAVAYEMCNMYINGDPVANPDQPGGLVYRFLTDLRLSDGSAAPATQKQVIDANKQDRDFATAGETHAFLDDIHALLSLIDGGNPDVLITNRQGILAFGKAARRERLFRTDRDQFGRGVDIFGEPGSGVPVIDAGYTGAGAFTRGTQVIPTSTSANDLVSDSIFAVKFGQTQSGGLQKRPPESQKFAENSADWPRVVGSYEHVYGFQVTNPFSVAVYRRGF